MKTFKPKKRRTGIIFSILGLILIIFSLAGVFWWETKGRSELVYKDVIVLNRSVEEGEVISEDMITKIKVDPSNLIDGALRNKDDVLGKKAKNYIPKYSQLSSQFFLSQEELMAKEEKYIFTIPVDWIITFPNSLRKGDIIYLYPVKVYKDEGVLPGEEVTEKVYKYFNEMEMIAAKVAFCKDSGNREVVDINGEEGAEQGERYYASSNIDAIEIMVDFKDVQKLQKLSDNSFKFIILYKTEI
jgi:hypothetical protein